MKRDTCVVGTLGLAVVLAGCGDAPSIQKLDVSISEDSTASGATPPGVSEGERKHSLANTLAAPSASPEYGGRDATGDDRAPAPAPPDGDRPGVPHGPRAAARGDSLDLAAFVALSGYRIERELSRADGYVAVIARRPEEDAVIGDSVPQTVYDGLRFYRTYLKWVGTGYVEGDRKVELADADTMYPFSFTEDAQRDGFGRVRELLLLHEGVDTLRLLTGPQPIELFTPDSAVWMRAESGAVSGFQYTVNDPVEGGVWMRIFAVAGDSLALVFGDDGHGCTPSDLRDLDGDGSLELIAYGDDLFGSDCTHPCRQVIRDVPRPPATAWPTVHMQISSLQWDPAEHAYAAFYAELAQEYAGMADRAGSERTCGFAPGIDAMLREWAARADSIARPSAR